jgi:hypothetical protein
MMALGASRVAFARKSMRAFIIIIIIIKKFALGSKDPEG